ncbi:hypothetical protein SERLA73DRAFT_69285 [Serpula lacrymans var. lacrymans S7.3]|uniref:Transaldolase n=1 Tax=Serpula lacrymans var. lacrymans (strain S7.3) TaxID=936435 RepID=F8PJ49_SERL3|nr:hypothetical protein SERLA73DRAFT_69285 [Serpula lacrymans var. lacrymans S7.3]
MSNPTLLSQIRTLVSVDIDSMSTAVATRHTDSSTLFCDMTSNQAIVHNEAVLPENAHVLKDISEYINSTGIDIKEESGVLKAIDLVAVLLAKQVYPYLTGYVLVQTSPSFAFDTEKTIAHAKNLVSTFEANGIPRNRVCIKIPTSAESIVACQYLAKLGINTLATCLFSVPQAVAASQAGCLYVAPYFNELRMHFEPGLWKEYQDTVKEHPVVPVIQAIVIALVRLRPDHLTLSGAVLDKLSSTPAVSEEMFSEVNIGVTASREVLEINYLVNGAEPLKKALELDAEANRKLQDAVKIFGEMEDKTKEFLRARFAS